MGDGWCGAAGGFEDDGAVQRPAGESSERRDVGGGARSGLWWVITACLVITGRGNGSLEMGVC